VSLSNYIVTLPDGSEGGLDDFYYAIQASEIEITDDGYVLSDGTLLPLQIVETQICIRLSW
jgi:hypothetical protein